MRIQILGALAALALSGCSLGAADSDVEAAPVLAAPQITTPPERDPKDLNMLFWDSAAREARFREMEEWYAGHEVAAANEPMLLEDGAPFSAELQAKLRAYMSETNAAGVIILQNGRVRFEEYRLGFGPEQRWKSFSVAKSFTSTLLGAAIADGFIGSVQDPVTAYIPELEGSAYDGVTVEQLATMTSGVAWNEDYTDPASDVSKLAEFVLQYGPDAIVAQMKALPREAPAGEKWSYKTGETNLLGLLVENAVGLPLAHYAQTKIIEPAGFEGDMFWMVDLRGGNIGGCCIALRLSDYARFGQFALDGGENVVPESWFAKAGDSLVDFGDSGFGYGYQWWTYPGGAYGAQGIFGQAITIEPEKKIVAAVVGNWPVVSSQELRRPWVQLVSEVAAEN